ncbi:MAG: hypothetical protein H6622_13295 [Halobacteriovoraceae bacterium]|nr:hypothetical protein [Halobacteriovoraceae bacterium]
MLKVAFPYDKKVEFYEPTKIYLSPEYAFLENIYSTLIRLDPKTGEPIPNLAKSFVWDGNNLEITLKNNLKTSSGAVIKPVDVVNSLKRLVILSENTHGRFKAIVCPNLKIEKLADECENLLADDTSNTVTIKTPSRNDFLIPMLAAIDFAIIPTSSIDEQNLSIKDYSNTSGPYFVVSDDGKGGIELKANKDHHLYNKNIPQKVKFIPAGFANYESSLELFKKGQVDFITTIDKKSEHEVYDFSKKYSCSKHTTMNLRTHSLIFTSKGIKELTLQQRKAIGAEFKRAFNQFYVKSEIYKNTDQFFPAFGEAWLNSDEIKDLENLLKYQGDLPDKQIIINSVRVPNALQAFYEYKKGNMSNIVLIESEAIPSFSGTDDKVHAFILGPDTGFLEDISLITYSINSGAFGPQKEMLNNWLSTYMKTPEKTHRIKMLKEMHKRILSNYYTVPLVSVPYVSCVRDNWNLNFSQFYANDPIWQITKK